MKPSGTGLPSQELDYETLFEQIAEGLRLVTANSRLARVLSGQFRQWRIDGGHTQWQTPSIQSWDVWLAGLWEEAGLLGLNGTGLAVPGARQLTSLWEQVLQTDPKAQRLLRPESLAPQLRDSRRLIVEWQLDMRDPAWFGNDNENHEAFYRWNQAFESLCLNKHWVPPEDRTALICKAIRDQGLTASGPIALLGFDELSPSQHELVAALLAAAVQINTSSITAARARARMWKGKDSQDEMVVMARWVRQCLETRPDSRIAVVVPDLQSRRQDIERHLLEVLSPGFRPGEARARPWNTSMGIALARVPMIEAAFDVLALLNHRIDIQDIGRALRSPWLRGGLAERNSRALLEKCLRDNYPRQFKLGEALYRAREYRKHDHDRRELPEDMQEPRAWNSPGMAEILGTLIRFEREQRSNRKASAWAEAFDQLLASLGWPLASESELRLTTQEHSDHWQAFQSWQDALRELASLDATSAELKRSDAIRKLQQICRDRVFQPRTPEASVQVLGMYEASGLRFDHLWVLGLHSDNWPPSAQPNPFIPGTLQQQAQLPHCSPQRELEVARTVTQRLLETADDIVFSYPGMIDGEDTLSSPLLDKAGIKAMESLPCWQQQGWQSMIAQSGQPVNEPLSMPDSLTGSTARGGSSILRNQALCPFRAFARNRLGAESLETPVDGISAMLHGSLVHRVLENFWRETVDQQALLALDEEQLRARIRSHVDHALDEERGLMFRPAFREVEADRLCRQAGEQLELEKTREPFEVAAFEKEVVEDIEGLPIRLIIDRVDQLPDGGQAIVDYKTGRVDPKKWFGERPEDPQLPLYAISAETTPAAVVFSVVRDDGCLYKGVVRYEGIFPNLPPKKTKTSEYLVEAGVNLPQTIRNWRQVLHRLMADFLAGQAAIDPKDGSSTCKNSYCELQPLCRVGELAQFEKTSRTTPLQEPLK